MYLKEARLYNWRKFRGSQDGSPGVVVHFKKGLNVLIGENDSGKTAIIDAIRMVLGTNSKTSDWITDDDFSIGTDNLVIECIFNELSEEEEAYFLEWLSISGEQYENTSLRVVLRSDKYKDANQIEKISKNIIAGPENYEQGFPSIAQEYLRVTYLKPLRDAENELRPGYRSRVAKVIEGLDFFRNEENKENVINEFQNAFDSLTKKLQEPVLDKVDSHLDRFLNNADLRKSDIQNKSLTFKEILRRLELNFNDINSGLGSTNILFIALELIALKEQDIGAQLTLIEEIEAHLHPQSQLRVIKAFERYLEDNSHISAQYILTTHSPTLASSVKLENLIVIYEGDAYPMGPDYTKLEQGDYAFLDRFLDATKANLFFAKGVILVEGFAENLLVPAIAEAIGRPLHQHGVSIVNVQGTQFNRYIPVFLRRQKPMNFPVSVITDMDISPESYYIQRPDSGEKFSHIKTPKTPQDIKSELSGKGNKDDLKNHFKVWKYSIDDIDCVKDDVEAEKKRKYQDDKEGVKVYLASPWTLEHSIAKSMLREEFEEIILELREYKNKNKKDEKKRDWSNIADTHERATKTYRFVLSNSLSKAIIAQQLSDKILAFDSDKKESLESDEELNYIIKAIWHATGGDIDANS